MAHELRHAPDEIGQMGVLFDCIADFERDALRAYRGKRARRRDCGDGVITYLADQPADFFPGFPLDPGSASVSARRITSAR